jgi:hypothetical protein
LAIELVMLGISGAAGYGFMRAGRRIVEDRPTESERSGVLGIVRERL